MISVSANFATAITATTREIRAYLDFNSGTIFRGADGLISIRWTNSLMDENRVSVGCACSSYVECEWFNNLTGVSLANSYFDAYIGVVESYAQSKPVGSIEDDTAVVEYVKLGRFWVTDIERGKATTKVTAYDAMSKASGEYTPTVTAGVNGFDVASIISDIETQCSISGTITGTAYVDKIFESTGREQLGWLCSVLYGDGSSFVIDRTTGDLTAVNFVKSVADGSIDDTTIYLDGVEDKPTFTIGSVEMGTDEATYTAGSGVGISKFNPYATQTLVDSIYADVNGMSFTPMKLHFRGDPRIEVGDLLTVTTDGNSYDVTVMKQTLSFNGGLECTIECFGDLEAHYIMSKSPTEAQIQRTNTVVAEMAEALENADNGIITTIKDADGFPTELLILNSMDKDTATSVWRWNINGLGHTNAYNGGTYNFALDDQGRINASMLIIGTITDQQGYNSWNLDTGAFNITNGTVNITTLSDSDDIIKLNHQTSSAKYVSSEMTPSWLKNEYHYDNGTNDTTMGIFLKTTDSAPIIKAYRSIDRTPTGTKGSGDFWYSSELDHRYLKFRQAAQSYEEGDATLRFQLSGSDGTMVFYDSNGTTKRFGLSTKQSDHTQNGIVFLNASGAETAEYNATKLILKDGSTTYDRTLLDNTGLTFRNSSNVVTATYPSYGLYAQDMQSRNLCVNTAVTTTKQGVTFTVNSNGSVTCSGQSTDTYTDFVLSTFTLPAGTYILSGGVDSNMALYCAGYYSASSETTFTLSAATSVTPYIRARSAGGNRTVTVYPMIRPATVTDSTYYPYAMTNRELTEYVGAATSKQSLQWSTATSWTSTGLSYVLEAGYWYMVEGIQSYDNAVPSGVAIVRNYSASTKYIYSKTENDNFTSGRAWATSALISCDSAFTIQLWAKAASAGVNNTVYLRVRKMAAL